MAPKHRLEHLRLSLLGSWFFTTGKLVYEKSDTSAVNTLSTWQHSKSKKRARIHGLLNLLSGNCSVFVVLIPVYVRCHFEQAELTGQIVLKFEKGFDVWRNRALWFEVCERR